ncbi:hypothetical protein LTR17_022029 [Elasticomyces elasticus]|nr:hypothetical protein LTR17_022029 [Elasticomyces elasticus]
MAGEDLTLTCEGCKATRIPCVWIHGSTKCVGCSAPACLCVVLIAGNEAGSTETAEQGPEPTYAYRRPNTDLALTGHTGTELRHGQRKDVSRWTKQMSLAIDFSDVVLPTAGTRKIASLTGPWPSVAPADYDPQNPKEASASQNKTSPTKMTDERRPRCLACVSKGLMCEPLLYPCQPCITDGIEATCCNKRKQPGTDPETKPLLTEANDTFANQISDEMDGWLPDSTTSSFLRVHPAPDTDAPPAKRQRVRSLDLSNQPGAVSHVVPGYEHPVATYDTEMADSASTLSLHDVSLTEGKETDTEVQGTFEQTQSFSIPVVKRRDKKTRAEIIDYILSLKIAGTSWRAIASACNMKFYGGQQVLTEAGARHPIHLAWHCKADLCGRYDIDTTPRLQRGRLQTIR